MRFKKLGLFALISLFTIFYSNLAYADTDDGTGDDSETTVTVPAKSKDAIGNMLLQSVSLIGIPYRWGGNTPETGMDCSGFIRYLYKNSLGINLPRTASEMSRVGKRVPFDNVEPGDLLFFNTTRGANTHVGMYLGNNKMIVAPRTGKDIQIADLNGYYRSHLNGVKRIVQEDEDDDGNTTLENFQGADDEALPGGYKRASHGRHHGSKYSHRSKSAKAHKSVHKAKVKAKAKKRKKAAA